MLQQTQVATVIPYYKKFIANYPDVESLAKADIDAVLHLWTGLGYYARARNLHKTAQIISNDYRGIWPDNTVDLTNLPGIGRSTAGAIASLGMGQRASILDGNVKRVFARLHAVEGWPGTQSTQKKLWEISEHYTPKKRFDDYNQAIMDLGALICKRSQPQCESCPVNSLCAAKEASTQQQFPERKPKQAKKVKSTYLLIGVNGRHTWLEQRPQTGVWGGLWSFPEFLTIDEMKGTCQKLFGTSHFSLEERPPKRHTFTHFHLDYTPVVATIKQTKGIEPKIGEGERGRWFNFHKGLSVGLPAPVLEEIQLLQEEA